MEDVVILPPAVDTRPVVVDAVVGIACAGPMSGSRPFVNEPLHWGPCCLVPCRSPSTEDRKSVV